jgi:hypothetical protein
VLETASLNQAQIRFPVVQRELIEDAVGNGCRRAFACATLEISIRTYQRWARENHSACGDQRKTAKRAAPANKLSEASVRESGV